MKSKKKSRKFKTVLSDAKLRDTVNRNERSLKINEEWLTSEQAAKYLKISVPTLWNLTSNGKIPFHKFGRRNRYFLTELRELLFSQKRGVPYGN
jgi:excisionase family DNA binding protein